MAVVACSPRSRRRPRRSLHLVIGLPLLAMAMTAGYWLSAQVGGAAWAPPAAPTTVAVGADAVRAYADYAGAARSATAQSDLTAQADFAAQPDFAYPAAVVVADLPVGAAMAPPAPVAVPATGADPATHAQRAPPARLA